MQVRFNEKYQLIKKAEKGKDRLVDSILTNPNGPDFALFMQAKEIFDSKNKKQYVEACLLSSSDFKRISELLEIPEEVVKGYSDIFFNVIGYDRLSKLEVLEKTKDKDELALKTWTLHQGLDFIAWRLGKHVNISPTDGLNELFNTCMYKSKEALFNGNSSTASIESTKWVKLSLDIARLLKLWVVDADPAKKDMELAIREVVPSFRSIDELLAEAEQAERDSIENSEEGNEE